MVTITEAARELVGRIPAGRRTESKFKSSISSHLGTLRLETVPQLSGTTVRKFRSLPMRIETVILKFLPLTELMSAVYNFG